MPSGFVRKTASPGRAPLLIQTPSGWTVPTTASPYFGSVSRIVCPPARIAPAARTCSSAPAKTARDELRLELLREGRDREREQRRAAHGEDVVERVRRRDPSEERRVVDERREEVDREDERALVVEPVDGRVVRRIEADEEVLRLRGDEALQQLLEPRRGVLRRAAAADGEAREARSFHAVYCRRNGRGCTRHRWLVGHRARHRPDAAGRRLRADARLAPARAHRGGGRRARRRGDRGRRRRGGGVRADRRRASRPVRAPRRARQLGGHRDRRAHRGPAGEAPRSPARRQPARRSSS